MTQLFVDGVVFDREEIFYKLFKDLAQSQLVDLSVGSKPTNLVPDLLENALPVDHLIELVFYVCLFLHLNFLSLHVLRNFFHFRHNIRVKLLSFVIILQILQVSVAGMLRHGTRA